MTLVIRLSAIFLLHVKPVLEVRILFKNFFGSVSERLMEAVLKTVDGKPSVGSNPTAVGPYMHNGRFFGVIVRKMTPEASRRITKAYWKKPLT